MNQINDFGEAVLDEGRVTKEELDGFFVEILR